MTVEYAEPSRHRYHMIRNSDEIASHVFGSGKDVLSLTGDLEDWSLHLAYDRILGRDDLSNELIILCRSDFGSIEAGARLAMLARREYQMVTAFIPGQARGGTAILPLSAHRVIITPQTAVGYNDLHSGDWALQSESNFGIRLRRSALYPLDNMPPNQEALRLLIKQARTPVGAARILHALGLSKQSVENVRVQDWAREFEIPIELASLWHNDLADLCLDPDGQLTDFECEFYSAKTASVIGRPWAMEADAGDNTY